MATTDQTARAAGPGTLPAIRRIGTGDLHAALRAGIADFKASRSDVVVLCLVYPLAGIVLARLAFDYALLPLVFPAASGFAILGPVFALALYEISRRRERGEATGWATAFAVARAPAFGSILGLGAILLALFATWIGVAQAIHAATLGAPPASAGEFLRQVATTPAGQAMAAIGIATGAVFAVAAFAISVVSFPLMLDREAGLATAVVTSVRAVAANPVPMAAWGAIVVAGLALGSAPVFLGLVIALPVLGHATWHLYRRVVA